VRQLKFKKDTAVHPYTPESIKTKLSHLKILSSLLEGLVFFPIIDIVMKNQEFIKYNLLMVIGIVIALTFIFYLFKNLKNKHNIEKWMFLDDKIAILRDRKLDGEISTVEVDKRIIIIAINMLLVMPISLTFSAILSGAISFVSGLAIKSTLINGLIQYIILFIIFENFYMMANRLVVRWIENKKDLVS
jgi:uncharacterized membrane protein